MNEDQKIRWLMENIDAEALAEANRNGSTIMYFAGIAGRWPNDNGVVGAAAPRPRAGRVQQANVEVEPEPVRPARRQAAPRDEAINLMENQMNVQAPQRQAAQPARQARQARQANGNADRVRVGGY